MEKKKSHLKTLIFFLSFCHFHTSGRTANGNWQLTVKQTKPMTQLTSQHPHTYLLTTATGKLKAGTSVLLLAMPSALKEIKSEL